jgi:tetratricopeptide (TPR) repeat protein
VGSKLAILAAVIALGSATLASADQAGDLFKQGTEAYKQGKYDEAAQLLKKAYDLDHNPNTLFALAQAERLLGECKPAAIHYKKVLEQISDLTVAKLVQQDLALCEKQDPTIAEPKPEPSNKPEPAQPQIVTKTVTRDVGKTDKVAATLATLGGLALGASGGLYLAASANRDAADKARTLGDHDTLAASADTDQKMMFVAAGAGVAMLGYAIYRWTSGGSESSTASAVSVVPTRSGGAVAWTARW